MITSHTGRHSARLERAFRPSPSVGVLAAGCLMSCLPLSAQTPTLGGGTIASPAVGPAPAYNYEYGPLIGGAVLVKNWDFGTGTGSTIRNMSEMSSEFQYYDQFNQIVNNGSYGAKIVSPDVANRFNSNQPVEGVNTASPVREFFSSSLKTYLVPLNGATTMSPQLQNVGNGSFMAKWRPPRGGSLLGKDIIWETRVRYVTPKYFWFAIWAAGNKWGSPSGAEVDLIESYGYNKNGSNNFDGRYWHSDVVGNAKTIPITRAQEESDYVNNSWSNYMRENGVTSFDATQWHTWTWVYKADNTFTVFLDGAPVQRGQTWWTYGAYPPDTEHVPLDVCLLFDASWSNNGMEGLKEYTLPASELVGKYYEFDYSRVYYREPTTNDIKNLALTATVGTFSSQEANNPVSKVINNIYNNSADRWSPQSAGFPHYFELDLGADKYLTGTQLIDVIGASFKYKIETKKNGGTYSILVDKTGSTAVTAIHNDTFPTTTARFVKVTITGSTNNTTWIGIREFRVMGTDAPLDKARGKPTVTSSNESASYPGANAVDGNTGSRWSSNYTDNQWIYVDLGATEAISRVRLKWEAAYATAYKIQTSNNATTWTDLVSVTGGDGAEDNHTGLSGSGRYVRILGVTRKTTFGISLFDFEVY